MKKIIVLLILLLIATPLVRTATAETDGTGMVLIFSGAVVGLGVLFYLYGLDRSKEIRVDEAEYIRDQTKKRYIEDFIANWKGKSYDDLLMIYKTPSNITEGDAIKLVTYSTCTEAQYGSMVSTSNSFFTANTSAKYNTFLEKMNLDTSGRVSTSKYGEFFTTAFKVGNKINFTIDNKLKKIIDVNIESCTFN